MGETPDTLPRALEELDAAISDLSVLRAKVADMKGELDNVYALMRATTAAHAAMAVELEQAHAERDQLRESVESTTLLVEELTEEREALRRQVICGDTLPRQTMGDGGYHGARATDPETSKEAVRNRPVNWDTQRGIALRIHYENPQGLNDWEVSVISAELPCGGLPRDSNWKRVGDLRTEYRPPLIAPLLDSDGKVVTRRGQRAVGRTVYAITDEGREFYLAMEARKRATGQGLV